MNIKQITYRSGDLQAKFVLRKDRSREDVAVIGEVFCGDVYELKKLKARGVEPKFCIDVGGHIGTFMVLAKKLWPDLQIVAFEPTKENAELYRMNAEVNGFTGVTVIQKAISYEPERRVFVNFKGRATGGGTYIKESEEQKFLETNPDAFVDGSVVFTSLEEALEPFQFNTVDLAKFDCEGGEREAFRKMSDELLNKLIFIVGEYHIFEPGSQWAEKYMYRFKNHNIRVKFAKSVLGPFWAYPKEK